jgi:hypothetical protein
MRRAAALLAILLLASCSGAPDSQTPDETSAPDSPTSGEVSTPGRTEVDWSGLPTEYQRIIDEETAERDCVALQEMFDVAPDRADLLSYIDEALREADCY